MNKLTRFIVILVVSIVLTTNTTYVVGKTNDRNSLGISGAGLWYSTYLGGSLDENIGGMVIDSDGYIYIAGNTDSPDFPNRVPGSGQTGGYAENDLFVAKLCTGSCGSGTDVVKVFGGSSYDGAYAIALGPDNSIYIAGHTDSSDFDTTANAYQRVLRGGGDGFIIKLSRVDLSVSYSTYFGGDAGEDIYGIAVDGNNNVYVSGCSSSLNLPIRPNPGAYQSTSEGNSAFVSKFNFDAIGDASLIYSTYLGGEKPEWAYCRRTD